MRGGRVGYSTDFEPVYSGFAENSSDLGGDSDECDHTISAQADPTFRGKLTRAFRGKLTHQNE